MYKHRVRCMLCKCFFYAEDSDLFEGQYYCDSCYDKMQKCVVCGKVFSVRQDTMNAEGICRECRDEYKVNNGGYVSPWLIIRFNVLRKDKFTCRYCGRSPLEDEKVKLHCDHIIPRAKGGIDKMDNLVTSCVDCNQGKVDVMLDKEQQRKIIQRKLF